MSVLLTPHALCYPLSADIEKARPPGPHALCYPLSADIEKARPPGLGVGSMFSRKWQEDCTGAAFDSLSHMHLSSLTKLHF